MSKEQQAQKPEGVPSERGGKEPIPVKMLRFRHGETVDIPGKLGAQAISTTTDAKPGQARHAIEYLPWMRHHRVAFHPAGVGTAMEVRYIHETWATWEPA